MIRVRNKVITYIFTHTFFIINGTQKHKELMFAAIMRTQFLNLIFLFTFPVSEIIFIYTNTIFGYFRIVSRKISMIYLRLIIMLWREHFIFNYNLYRFIIYKCINYKIYRTILLTFTILINNVILRSNSVIAYITVCIAY